MKSKKIVAAVLACAMITGCAAGLTACNPDTEPEKTPHTAVTLDAASANIVVKGYEWGPAVIGVVIKFNANVSDVTKDTFTVKTANANRTVKDAYTCDANGNKTTSASQYVHIELTVDYNAQQQSAVGSPFSYDWQNTQKNKWVDSYSVSITVADCKTFKIGDKTYEATDKWSYNVTKAEERLVPQTATWHKDTVHYTGESKDITLQRASWAPTGAADDGQKNPLIIWLHGAGEGGTDIDIDLLGNEVTALTSDNDTNVQGYFKTNGSAGAYVLAVQTPTIWMDVDGTGKYNIRNDDGTVNEETTAKQESYYTGALWQAITSYVESNTDVDTDRIYLGGCSNGGYMTMNMMFEHGDYFAAFYPVCEAYRDKRISDDMIEQVKDYNIWFMQSANDPTVEPEKHALATFTRLLDAGAKNVHLTVPATVVGKDKAGQDYNGHWSWIYTFNDDVKTEFDNSKVTGMDYLTPANCNKAGNMWQWLSEQSKGEVITTEDYTLEAESGVITDGEKKEPKQDKIDMSQAQNPAYWEEFYKDPDNYTMAAVVPTVETTDLASGTVTNIGNFYGAGASVKWVIDVEKDCDVTITLHAASAVSQFDFTTFTNKIASVDLSKNEYVKLKVNEDYKTFTGILPSSALAQDYSNAAEAYHNFGTGSVTVHLKKGENTIILECVKENAGLNIDKLVISSPYAITFTATDNSSRVPQQPQG